MGIRVRVQAKTEKVREILSSLPLSDVIELTDNSVIGANKNPERVVTIRFALFEPDPAHEIVPESTYKIVKNNDSYGLEITPEPKQEVPVYSVNGPSTAIIKRPCTAIELHRDSARA